MLGARNSKEFFEHIRGCLLGEEAAEKTVPNNKSSLALHYSHSESIPINAGDLSLINKNPHFEHYPIYSLTFAAFYP